MLMVQPHSLASRAKLRSTMPASRQTVDLSAFPDLVVIYLGMRVEKFSGLSTLIRFGSEIQASVDARPEGLLVHENITFGFVPPHAGMRQYWRDFDSLEHWTRAMPHQRWWREFLRDPKGVSFWHESYSMRGGMEAIYDNVRTPIGLMNVGTPSPARGGMFTARRRLQRLGDGPDPVLPETEI